MYMRRPFNILTGELIENKYLGESVPGRTGLSPFTDYKNEIEKSLRSLKHSFSK
jgi:hypothetical protein